MSSSLQFQSSNDNLNHVFPQSQNRPYRGDSLNMWSTMSDGLPDTPPPEELNVPERTHDDQIHQSVTPPEEPLVAVIGIGYVGLHLVTAFAPHYSIIAFDVSKKRLEIVAPTLSRYSSITWTTNACRIAPATHFLIAVPTSLSPDKGIDTSYLREAITSIALYARPGATVVVESSVAVGMTRQFLAPLMHSHGLKAGMSPERVDPGRTEPPMEVIPKIISALDDITPGSLKSIEKLYSKVFQNVVVVSKPEVAEMMKLYENCQRMLCIAYVNEMADACIPYGIDPYEVCAAASTKPFGYMPFTPSLGVGGPCIPVNPYYLLSNSEFPLLQAATERMSQRPAIVGNRAMVALHRRYPEKFAKRRPYILVVGAGFKRGQSLINCSPGVDLMKALLQTWEAHVSFVDPLVDESAIPFVPRLDEKTDWNKASLELFDLIIVAVRQEGLDFKILEELDSVQVEMWN